MAFEGVELATLPAAERAFRGIAHVPEGRQVFEGHDRDGKHREWSLSA